MDYSHPDFDEPRGAVAEQLEAIIVASLKRQKSNVVDVRLYRDFTYFAIKSGKAIRHKTPPELVDCLDKNSIDGFEPGALDFAAP
jgi:hypothetical protein